MQKITIKISVLLLTALVATSSAIAEEVVYLKAAKACAVAIYPAPDEAPLSTTISCGEKAIVLERKGRFARVRTGDETAVWVVEQNITAEEPAEQEVLRLMEYQKKIEAELASLNEQVNRLSETTSKLIEALMAAEEAKK